MHHLDLHQFQSAALSIVKDVIVGIDTEYRVIYWNNAAEQLFNISAADAVGQPYSSLYDFRWLREGDALEAAKSLEEHKTWRGEVCLLPKDGREIFVEITTSFIELHGKALGMMAIMRDITERKKADQQKEALILELRDALNKVKDLEEIITVCAWSGQVKMNDQWISMEKFLETRFGLKVSHGIAPNVAEELRQRYNLGRQSEE
jgi:PAS domain S-box-containing protein